MPKSNEVVAELLGEFADLLALQGADPFRVRAYEKAARAVALHHEDVGRLDHRGLEAIPSIGNHIADKILELRRSGSIEELDEMREKVPAGVRDLLRIPGLGPKRAQQVHDEMGISSVNEFVDALEQGTFRRLKGWGGKTEQRFREAVTEMHRSGDRIQIATALAVAKEIVAALAELPGVSAVCHAGSLRRMQETIGDVDILAASRTPERVRAAFASIPDVARVVSAGHTRATAITSRGLQVDLRIVPEKAWGSALVYLTGSKAHNVRLRQVAMRQGLKLSEYGLFDAESGKLLASRSEAEIYEKLGMDWILPTLRENRGEVEAALGGALPALVEDSDLRGDLHMHTNLTDGLASLEDMVSAARSRGYSYCAITDHAPLLVMQRMTRDKALQQRQEVRRLQARYPKMALLHGSELNIQADGSVDWDNEFLAGFDLLVASVHSRFNLPRDQTTRRLIRAMENPYINVIGHPMSRSIGRRPPIDFDAIEVFKAAARTGTALEVNCFPDRLDLNDDMVRLAAKLGVHFAISTDSHSLNHFDNVRYGVATAQRGWVEPAQVINTWPLRRLRLFLAKRRRSH